MKSGALSRFGIGIASLAMLVFAGVMIRVAETLPATIEIPSPVAQINGPPVPPIKIPTSITPVILGGVLVWFSQLARQKRTATKGSLVPESLLLGFGLVTIGAFLPPYFLRVLSTPPALVGRAVSVVVLTAVSCGGCWYYLPEHRPASFIGKVATATAVFTSLAVVIPILDFVDLL